MCRNPVGEGANRTRSMGSFSITWGDSVAALPSNKRYAEISRQALEPLQGDRSSAGEGRRRGALRISARFASARERALTYESKSSAVSWCGPAKSLSRSATSLLADRVGPSWMPTPWVWNNDRSAVTMTRLVDWPFSTTSNRYERALCCCSNPKYLTSIASPFGSGRPARSGRGVNSYTSVVGSTGGEPSGPAFGVSSDGTLSDELARFCFRWIRRAALSFCRSKRRISFWRFLKVSICSGHGADLGTASTARPCRSILPAGLPPPPSPALRTTGVATAPAFILRARLVHVERATFQAGTVQRRDCPIRLGGIRHLDESEAARTPSVSVGHQVHTIDLAVRLEKRSHRRLGCGKIQIAYEDVFHVLAPSVFQLCGLDEADQNGQALAGLLKGTIMVSCPASLLQSNCPRRIAYRTKAIESVLRDRRCFGSDDLA